jgi:hypothetical protein
MSVASRRAAAFGWAYVSLDNASNCHDFGAVLPIVPVWRLCASAKLVDDRR